jgi:hypothetical protein
VTDGRTQDPTLGAYVHFFSVAVQFNVATIEVVRDSSLQTGV